MSFVANEGQQISMSDSFTQLTNREQKMLEKSWAIPFSEKIFPAIDEGKFAVLYGGKASRPNTPVNVIIGLLILKEFMQQSDDDILESLMFDVRYQVALRTTSFDEQPLSDRSLGRFRARCIAYEEETGIDLIKECVLSLSKQIAEVMNVTPSLTRMDSFMVASNIKKMSRLELLYTTVANMVKTYAKDFESTIPEELEHYCNKEDRNKVIYHNRSTSTDERIRQVLEDASLLLHLCTGSYDESSEYHLLLRVLKEQAKKDDAGNYQLKDNSDGSMDSSILQNPADPDATFRDKNGKHHRGYVANVTESVNETDSIITDYQYEQNNYSDSHFLKDALGKKEPCEEQSICVTDGAYNSSENVKLAKEKNIHLITTGMTGIAPKDIYGDFEFNEEGTRIVRCPNGIIPKSSNHMKPSNQCYASFPISICQGCPLKDQCRPKFYKRTAKIVLSIASRERAIQQRYRGTEDFKLLAGIRNGVESIPSLMRRKYDIDTMPVRGRIPTKNLFGFKVAALNFKKLCKYEQGLALNTLNEVTA